MKKRSKRRQSPDHRDQDLQLKNVIRNHIDMVLFLCEGNRSEAAVVLGIHRRTLQRMQRGKRIID